MSKFVRVKKLVKSCYNCTKKQKILGSHHQETHGIAEFPKLYHCINNAMIPFLHQDIINIILGYSLINVYEQIFYGSVNYPIIKSSEYSSSIFSYDVPDKSRCSHHINGHNFECSHDHDMDTIQLEIDLITTHYHQINVVRFWVSAPARLKSCKIGCELYILYIDPGDGLRKLNMWLYHLTRGYELYCSGTDTTMGKFISNCDPVYHYNRWVCFGLDADLFNL